MKKELANCKDLKVKDECLEAMTAELLRRGRWSEALALTDDFYDGYSKQRTLRDITIWQAENGNYRLALEMAETITDKYYRENCYEEISGMLLEKMGKEEAELDSNSIEVNLSEVSSMLLGG
jgi:hypothetical protein